MKYGKGKKAFGILVFLAVFAGITAIVMLLWNALIPGIVGWTAINYWQAAGMIILCRLLLGGFGKMHQMGHMMGGAKAFKSMNQKDMMSFHDKMGGMSPDERREYIRSRMAGFERDFGRDFNNRGRRECEKNQEETGDSKAE